MNRETFIALRKLSADLYLDVSSIRRDLDDAGIDQSRINFNAKVIDIWHSVLTEAEKSGKIPALLNVVDHEYGSNERFRHIYTTYSRATDPIHPEYQTDQDQKPRAIWLGSLALVILLIALWVWREWVKESPTSPEVISPLSSATIFATQEGQSTEIKVGIATTPQANDNTQA